MLLVLSEVAGAPAVTAVVRVGGIEVEYQALHRPNGAIRVCRTGRAEEPDNVRFLGARARVDDGEDRSIPAEDGPTSGGEGDAWTQGVNAARAGAHSDALTSFQQEADGMAADGNHARAALAYRSASAQADQLGRSDLANKLLRLAGKHYLCAAEARETPLRGIRQAYEMAAKCFLQAGNLPLAESSIRRVLSLDEALG